MAYIYQVSFDIRPDQMTELEIGSSLERVLGYLRTLLPAERGFITSRAMRSVGIPQRVHLVFQSVWEEWEDVERHRQSSLSEDKVLKEFEPHVALEDLASQIYEEVD
jgi:quinol monooxygenase YgiN